MEVIKWQTFLFCSLEVQGRSQIPFNIVRSSAQFQERLYLWNDCYDSSYFPRPRFKNPKIAVANVLGTDVGKGNLGRLLLPEQCWNLAILQECTFPCRWLQQHLTVGTIKDSTSNYVYYDFIFFKRVAFSPLLFFFFYLMVVTTCSHFSF